jgi:hypothetical protein
MILFLPIMCAIGCFTGTACLITICITEKVGLKDGAALYAVAVFIFIGFLASGASVVRQKTVQEQEWQAEADARYKEIYNQGMQAAEAGIPETACPYRKHGGKYYEWSPNDQAWLEGWIAKTAEMNKTENK